MFFKLDCKVFAEGMALKILETKSSQVLMKKVSIIL